MLPLNFGRCWGLIRRALLQVVFIDFFSEMKRPWTFYKSWGFAELLIMAIYIITGVVVYARQGQFTQSLFYFGVSKYSYQTGSRFVFGASNHANQTLYRWAMLSGSILGLWLRSCTETSHRRSVLLRFASSRFISRFFARRQELYYIVVRQWFKGPRLMSRQGYPFWLIGNCVIWAIGAFDRLLLSNDHS